jgi:hypothetical protein
MTALFSCQSVDIKPGSERIRVFEAEPKGCIFVGEIPSVQENTVTGKPPTEMDMDLPTRVDLRNKAHALSGNVIVFMSKNKKDAEKKSTTEKKEEDAVEKKIITVFLATVFRCPSAIVNQ